MYYSNCWFSGCAAALAFIYPLNKKRVEENVIELKKRRGEI